MIIEINIPDSLAGQEVRVKRFFDAMIYKLSKNAHKSGFESADIHGCLKRLREEANELDEAIRDGNTIEILLEAADCANFALIAATAAIERPQDRPSPLMNLRRSDISEEEPLPRFLRSPSLQPAHPNGEKND